MFVRQHGLQRKGADSTLEWSIGLALIHEVSRDGLHDATTLYKQWHQCQSKHFAQQEAMHVHPCHDVSLCGCGADVCIAAAVRTPMGSFQGSLASFSATDLGAIAIKGQPTRQSTQQHTALSNAAGVIRSAAVSLLGVKALFWHEVNRLQHGEPLARVLGSTDAVA